MLAVNAGAVAAGVLVLVVVLVVVGYLGVRIGATRRRVVDLTEQPTGTPSGSSIPPQGPQRYLVTIHLEDGGATRYTVVTAVDSKKAASIAFEDHRRRRAEAGGEMAAATPPASGGAPLDPSESVEPTDVRHVQVEHLGPVPRTDDGTLAFNDGDLFDRTEF